MKRYHFAELVSAGSVLWSQAVATAREGKKFRALGKGGKPHALAFIVTPADVRALAVRLDQWLEKREAA